MTGLHAINHFQIAEQFPKDKESATYAELSLSTGLPEFQLRRLLRQAMTQRIFTEPTEDSVAHTAASKMLLKPFVHERVDFTCEETWPAATKVHFLLLPMLSRRNNSPPHLGCARTGQMARLPRTNTLGT